ncbi:MAG TPA: ABC transporter permease [Thermoanaerobaculia bacterium]|nr:ABC transporter permease [Thermoanaerobaculia bacterium]
MIRHLLKLVWNRKRANALIVAEMFVSFLVIFAVLTGAVSIAGGWNRPIGFDWHDVWDVNMEFDIDGGQKASPELHASVMRMLDEVRGFPQVSAAAVSNTPPYAFSTTEGNRRINGRDVTMTIDDVTQGFADVMRVKVVRGRWFNGEDEVSQDIPIVVDTNFVKQVYGADDPIGQRLEEDETTFLRIVGVIEPFRKDGETSAPMNMVFRHVATNASHGRLGSHILVRLHPGTNPRFEEELSARLRQVAPDVSFNVRHMDKMRMNMLRARLSPLVAGGVIGLFLIGMVALGLTGVLWQNVTRRTREIGLRRAMGASGSSVHRQILAEVALLATVALVIGSIVVWQLPVLGAFSVVSPAAFTAGFLGALATIYALTVLCGLYPSWLASRLQPADALRYE